MAKITVLKHSVVIRGRSFDDCKMEYNRICNEVKRHFNVRCGLENLIFSNMTIQENECVVIFKMINKL